VPSVSKKQHNFMAAIANSPSFAKKAGVSQSVGKDFNEADKSRKFSKGGDMKKPMMPSTSPAGMRGYKPRRPEMTLDDVVTPEIRAKRAMMVQGAKDAAMQDAAGAAYDKAMPSPYKKGGGVKKMASGGSASKRADGVAQKGKTKGVMLKKGGMARGGKAC